MPTSEQDPKARQATAAKVLTEQHELSSPLTAMARSKVIPEAVNRQLASMWDEKEPVSRETAFLETATKVVGGLSEPETGKLLTQTLAWIAQQELQAAEKRQRKTARKNQS